MKLALLFYITTLFALPIKAVSSDLNLSVSYKEDHSIVLSYDFVECESGCSRQTPTYHLGLEMISPYSVWVQAPGDQFDPALIPNIFEIRNQERNTWTFSSQMFKGTYVFYVWAVNDNNDIISQSSIVVDNADSYSPFVTYIAYTIKFLALPLTAFFANEHYRNVQLQRAERQAARHEEMERAREALRLRRSCGPRPGGYF